MAVKFDFESLDKPFEADWPVVVSVPLEDGKVEEQRFSARFRILSDEEIKEIAADDKDGAEMYRRFFLGFGKGEEATLTPELFKKMMGRPYVRSALLRAYTQFSAGIAEKN